MKPSRARWRRTRPSRSRRPTSCAPKRCCCRRARGRCRASAPASPTPRSTAAARSASKPCSRRTSRCSACRRRCRLPPRSGRRRCRRWTRSRSRACRSTDTRRQIAVATASAYLAVITQKRQVDVSLTAIETARGQLDFNTRRREGGVGSRLNELRSAQILAAHASLARGAAAERGARPGSVGCAPRRQRAGGRDRRAVVRGPAGDA